MWDFLTVGIDFGEFVVPSVALRLAEVGKQRFYDNM